MENCGFAYTFEIINGKYKLPILYATSRAGVLRYSELQRLVGASHRTLANSLRDLEADGMIIRTEYSQIPPKVEYSLSPRGQSFVPILELLCEWGERHGSDLVNRA